MSDSKELVSAEKFFNKVRDALPVLKIATNLMGEQLIPFCLKWRAEFHKDNSRDFLQDFKKLQNSITPYIRQLAEIGGFNE